MSAAGTVELMSAHYDNRGRVNEIRPKIPATSGALVVVTLRGATTISATRLSDLICLVALADVVLVAGGSFAMREAVTTTLRTAGIKARFATTRERRIVSERACAS